MLHGNSKWRVTPDPSSKDDGPSHRHYFGGLKLGSMLSAYLSSQTTGNSGWNVSEAVIFQPAAALSSLSPGQLSHSLLVLFPGMYTGGKTPSP